MKTFLHAMLPQCLRRRPYNPPDHTLSSPIREGVFGPQYPTLYEQLLAKPLIRESEIRMEKRGSKNVLRMMAKALGRDFDSDLATARAADNPDAHA